MATLDERLLRTLVNRFYEKVRSDPQLGPIFSDFVADWDEHEERLTAFWSSIMLTSGRYKGNPFAAHLPFASRLSPTLFKHWLSLWRETAFEVCPDPLALQLEAKAQRIAASLEAGLLFRPDEVRPAPTGKPTL